jgi:hypothetical protein
MTHVQGTSKTITDRVLRTLNGKICSEMYKIFEERGDEIYDSVLDTIFIPEGINSNHKDEIYKIVLDETKQIFRPGEHKVKILEGVIKAMKRNGKTDPILIKMYKEMKKKERDEKSPFRRMLRSVTSKYRSGQLKNEAKTKVIKGVVTTLKTLKNKQTRQAIIDGSKFVASNVIT